MGKVITFHSYKGGTGKSLIAANVSASLVLMGYRVAIFDFDFLGPGLFTTFIPSEGEKPKENISYLNEIFFKTSSEKHLEEVLIEVTKESDPPNSKFFVGLANPEPSEINSILRMSRNDAAEAFRQILKAQDFLFENMKIDYLILDAGPGFRFDVANAIMISDIIVNVMKPSEADLIGTKKLISTISTFVANKAQGIIVNRAVSHQANPGFQNENLIKSDQELIVDNIKGFAKSINVPILGSVPCLCDVARGESRLSLITQEHPHHTFTSSLNDIISHIKKEIGNE
ncbi:MAG: MinD/ParA family ATP-binding protein [Candidatus Hodarchaeales archaeon]